MTKQQQGIFDARTLGKGKMLTLGLQHMFAMFGATVLVPVLTGLPMSATLLFAGLGTLIFHFLTKLKVPAFLGSSFAFIGGYAAVAGSPLAEDAAESFHPELLPYACIGVFAAGLVYFILAGLFAAYGAKKVMRFFPPIVTGPIIIAIGLTLSGTAISSCNEATPYEMIISGDQIMTISNWPIALLAIAIILVCNIWGKGMIRIIPILLGVLGASLVAVIVELFEPGMYIDPAKLDALHNASWLGLPIEWDKTVFPVIMNPRWGVILTAVITIVPISLATMVEHIGDMCAISSTTGKNYIEDPGLHRTLMGDGLATALASLFGAPANTTYGENTGVLNLTKVYDPRVIRIAAVFAILVSFCPKFSALIACMPNAVIGGVSLVLYGMISAVGVRNIVENQVDFTKTRNVVIAALILVLAIGIKYGAGDSIPLGSISLSGLAVAALAGIILNAILPGKDYEFGANPKGDKAVDFEVKGHE